MEAKNKFYVKLLEVVMPVALVLLLFVSSAYAYESITSRENAVTVDVRPEQIANGQPVTFKVRLNTHSVNLSMDMAAVSELRDNIGNKYQPVSWKGSPPGGHHRSGTLEFPKLEGSPKTVTLVIRNVANVPERIFEWDIE